MALGSARDGSPASHVFGPGLAMAKMSPMKRALALRSLRSVHPVGQASDRALARLAVFPRLGIAFSRVQKNANTFVMALLHELDGSVEASGQDPKAAHRIGRQGVRTLLRLASFDLVMVRRNPHTRVLSAFLHKFSERNRPRYGSRYRDFARTPSGFHDFLEWLADGHLSDNAHWDLQTRVLFPVEWYSTVLTFETLDRDLAAYFATRGISVPSEALAREAPAPGNHNFFAEHHLDEYATSRSAELVHELYAIDFRALGYPVEPPGSTER